MDLVSVIVITYNSSDYILDCLESIKLQTYENLELLISDDCSTDNTVELCNMWLEDNKQIFANIKLETSAHNLGIPSNCNRGLRLSSGTWVKLIAGDDALYPNSISDYMNFVYSNNSIKGVFANMAYFNQELNQSSFIRFSNYKKSEFSFPFIDAKRQLQLFARQHVPPAPSFFFNMDTVKELGMFDESLPYEDGPFLLKYTAAGKKMVFLDKVTVKYRVSNSFSNTISSSYIFNPFFKKYYPVFQKYNKHYLTFFEVFAQNAIFKIKYCFDRFEINRDILILKLAYWIISYPFEFVLRLIPFLLKLEIKYCASRKA